MVDGDFFANPVVIGVIFFFTDLAFARCAEFQAVLVLFDVCRDTRVCSVKNNRFMVALVAGFGGGFGVVLAVQEGFVEHAVDIADFVRLCFAFNAFIFFIFENFAIIDQPVQTFHFLVAIIHPGNAFFAH